MLEFQHLVLQSRVTQDYPRTSAGIKSAWARPWWYLASSPLIPRSFPPDAGSFPCWRSICQTCKHTTSWTFFTTRPEERTQHPWPLHLSVWESSVLHFLSSVQSYTSEGHYRNVSVLTSAVRNRSRGFPVAKHFNSTPTHTLWMTSWSVKWNSALAATSAASSMKWN